MTYLLIDNSNTRTKFVLSSPEALLPERYMIPTREVSGERLDEVLQRLADAGNTLVIIEHNLDKPQSDQGAEAA